VIGDWRSKVDKIDLFRSMPAKERSEGACAKIALQVDVPPTQHIDKLAKGREQETAKYFQKHVGVRYHNQ